MLLLLRRGWRTVGAAAAAAAAATAAAVVAETRGRRVSAATADQGGGEEERLRFLTPELVRAAAERFGTPVYVYSEDAILRNAREAQRFPRPEGEGHGLTVRFAMKALPNAAVLRLLDREAGLCFDCSSGMEVHRALYAGVDPRKLSLSSQELPDDFEELVGQLGVKMNACSLHQLEEYGRRLGSGRGQAQSKIEVGLRVNPGEGSGGTNKTNVGGPHASFGVWHEQLPEAKRIASRYGLKIVRLHTHIGSGSDPRVWQRVAEASIRIVEQLPDVRVLNLGGGYKVARCRDEVSTDLQRIGQPVLRALRAFEARTGRRLQLEIEPGTFLVANAGSLVTRVQDIVSTGDARPGMDARPSAGEGHVFLKLDTGMTEILRPCLYGAQHPTVVVPHRDTSNASHNASTSATAAVVGHCCETSDLLTPEPGTHDHVGERHVPAGTAIGDLCVVEGAGAYCSSMSAINYNSFPQAAEVLYSKGKGFRLIRRRQTLAQIIANELVRAPYEKLGRPSSSSSSSK